MLLNIELDDQKFIDQIYSAVEGGSNYWASFGVPKEYKGQPQTGSDFKAVRIYLDEDGREEAPDKHKSIVDADVMRIGVQRLSVAEFPAAKRHLANFLEDNSDAETADVILQMAIFGEVVFG